MVEHLLRYRPGYVAVDNFCGPVGSFFCVAVLARDENYFRSRVAFTLGETRRLLRRVGPLFDFIGKDCIWRRRVGRLASDIVLRLLFPVARRVYLEYRVRNALSGCVANYLCVCVCVCVILCVVSGDRTKMILFNNQCMLDHQFLLCLNLKKLFGTKDQIPTYRLFFACLITICTVVNR